ncbi:hypothetical protein FSP39_001141 [Pinctada imbricata]|uniref:C-type lectin domain-containing protein n=1 Tax=Pinctada imbricata TaxID=66713 RepID=A0AA88XRG0_PINIB|nr:hypothetical protein FSP39_001141 [Pinctada imbricata]
MPKSEEDNFFLESMMFNDTIDNTYIGLRMETQHYHDFYWDDDDKLTFTNWIASHPLDWTSGGYDPCVYVTKSNNYKWFDSSICGNHFTTMCQCWLNVLGEPLSQSKQYCFGATPLETTDSNDLETTTYLSSNTPTVEDSSTPSLLTTTHGIISTTKTSSCNKPCQCVKNNTISETELATKLNGIRNNLTLDKANLSSTLRKLNSAEDERTSSRIMGYMGAAVVASVGILLIVFDLTSVAKGTTEYTIHH